MKLSNGIPVCLTIAGLDPSGGAGVIADIKTFSVFGCHAAGVVTSVTFQNTQGVYGSVSQTPDSVRNQIEPVFDDFEVDAVKTGMLPSEEIIREIADIAKERGFKNLVVDPVVRSTSGFDLIDDSALKSLIEVLFPISKVVTPNLAEAERIAGFSIENLADMANAAGVMHELGASNVLIKGGHSIEGESKENATDRLYNESGIEIFESEFIKSDSTHGTGCTLSSAIAANLALGKSLFESIAVSKEFVSAAIRGSTGLGKGNSAVNQLAGSRMTGER